MAQSMGFSILVAVLAASLVMPSMMGASAFDMGELKTSRRRDLKILWNFVTNRSWSVETGIGIGFKYDEYGGKVKFGPIEFEKDENPNFDEPTLLQELLDILFG